MKNMDVTEITARLEQREAELAVINSVQEALAANMDMQGIYDLVGNRIRDLFDAQVASISIFDHENNIENFKYIYEKGERYYPDPRPIDKIRQRLIKTRKMILINENAAEAFTTITGEAPKAVPGTVFPKSMLFVPLSVGNIVQGYVSLQNLDREQAFSESDIQLLNTLANTMSAALENARLFNETEQRNAELAVINSVQEGLVAEMDMQGIYDLVGDRIRELFDAQVTSIVTFDLAEKMEEFRYLFEDGDRLYPSRRPYDKVREKIIKEQKTLLFNESAAEKLSEINGEPHKPVPGTRVAQSALYVPLMLGNHVQGYVTLQNLDREHAFSESDVRLLSTLANSMSVALENARLYNESEQRNAELGVINSVQQGLVAEMDMQGIYELVGERIRDLFDAQVAAIVTFDLELKMEHWAYLFEDGGRLYPNPRPYDKVREKIISEKKTLLLNENAAEHMSNINQKPFKPVPGTQTAKAVLYVPMVMGDSVRGYVTLQNLDRDHAFSHSDVRLLETLVNSMSVALENARLFNETTRLLSETEQRASELQTVNHISRAMVSQLEFDTLIHLVGEQMKATFKADIVYIALYDRDKDLISFPYEYGDKNKPRKFGDGFTERIISSNEPLLINKDIEEIREQLKAKQIGRVTSSFLAVPIQTGDVPNGVISVQSTEEENRFDENDLRLLSTIAANVSVSMQNAEAYEKLKSALDDLKAAQDQLVQQEKLASLGQLTAGIAHEIKNPLNFVNNFSELSVELVEETRDELSAISDQLSAEDKKRVDEAMEILNDIVMNLRKIHEHGSRADSIVKSMLEHSRGGSGKMEPTHLNELVKGFANLSFHGMRASRNPINVEMEFDLDESMGKVPLVSEDFSRVILNLTNNAFDAMRDKLSKKAKVKSEKSLRQPAEGAGVPDRTEVGDDTELGYAPKLTVRTGSSSNTVTIEIEDNGPGIPDDIKDKIMQPFFTTKKGTQGTGLGLSITNDIVKAHGGDLEVASQAGKRTTFRIKLPQMD